MSDDHSQTSLSTTVLISQWEQPQYQTNNLSNYFLSFFHPKVAANPKNNTPGKKGKNNPMNPSPTNIDIKIFFAI